MLGPLPTLPLDTLRPRLRLTSSRALLWASCFSMWAATTPAWAEEFYVAPDGDDANPGTEDQPFATVGRAQEAAAPGDTVWVGAGTFRFTSGTVGVGFTKPGQPDARIQYFALPGETPVFDLGGITNPSGRVTGFDVRTNHIHIRGMEITGVPQYRGGEDSWALRIQGSNNIIERMNVHHNEAPGIFITSGADNLILNCDSHHNYDPMEDGGSGDGFGCHSTGSGNVMRGCRGWYNSDDGYDFINAPGACTVENSWAWRNGYVPDTTTAAGNGAGFKAGGYGLDPATFPANVPRHTVQNCLAFRNRAQGFYANHHPGGIDFFNNTALNNNANFDMLADVGESSHTLRNNLAFGSGGTISRLSGGTDQSNSWNLGVTVTAEDFVNEMEEEAEAPRQADGSLPAIGFMHLVEGSDLIDQGEDVGLEYAGDAPDLGCFETGLAPMGAGGAGGSGGAGEGPGGMNALGGAMNGGAPGAMGGAGRGGTPGEPDGGGSSGVGAGGAGASAGAAGGGEGAVGGSPGPGMAPGGPAAPVPTAVNGPVGGASSEPGPAGGEGGSAASAGAGVVPASEGPASSDGGCGCRVAGARGGSAALWLGLGTLLGWRRRRGRARARQTSARRES